MGRDSLGGVGTPLSRLAYEKGSAAGHAPRLGEILSGGPRRSAAGHRPRERLSGHGVATCGPQGDLPWSKYSWRRNRPKPYGRARGKEVEMGRRTATAFAVRKTSTGLDELLGKGPLRIAR